MKSSLIRVLVEKGWFSAYFKVQTTFHWIFFWNVINATKISHSNHLHEELQEDIANNEKELTYLSCRVYKYKYNQLRKKINFNLEIESLNEVIKIKDMDHKTETAKLLEEILELTDY